MTAWTREEVWDAVDAWRWSPPGATRIRTDEFELAVTAGSYALTYVWGFRVADPDLADVRLRDVRRRIEAAGGKGARFQVTPRSRPTDLPERLVRSGYRPLEEAEILVWYLRDERGVTRQPSFRSVPELDVSEVKTEEAYGAFFDLATPIFGDPVHPEETRARFFEEFRRTLGATGHSGHFVAWENGHAVGRGGLELAGPVARFYGTGVLPEHRNRGIYGALVAARCAFAVGQGSEIVLVTARAGSSGPILRRHGFEPMGTIRVFEARWPDPSDAGTAHGPPP